MALTHALFVGVLAGVAYFVLKPTVKLSIEKVEESYDYVVIGAGSAGSVVAARLSEDADARVLVLEAGGKDPTHINLSMPLAAGGLQMSEYDWQYYTVPQRNSQLASMKGDNRGFWPRGKILGGSGMLNAMQYVRGNKYDYEEWKQNGCEGWGYEDVLPYFLKSEDILVDELKSSKYHQKGGAMAVSKSEVTPLTRRFVEAGKELGYKEVDYNGESQFGFGYSQVNVRGGERSSSYREMLRPAMERSNLHVAIGAHVSQILIENEKAVGVSFIKDGRKQFVNVRREVILSAGAIGSPQILMLSGVGPASHLQDLHIPVVKDLPVGRNLQDHIAIHVGAEINSTESLTMPKIQSITSLFKYFILKSGYLTSTILEGSAFIKTEENMVYPDLQVHLTNIWPPLATITLNATMTKGVYPEEDPEGLMMMVVALHPKSTGSITLQSRDPFDYPLIDPRYLDNRKDLDSLIKGIKIVEKLFKTKPFQEIGVNTKHFKTTICGKLEMHSDDFYECYIRNFAQTIYHPTSTCKMGSVNDPTAVVDPQLRVKGIQGLRVVDASIMPNVVSGNTNAATVMIAEKASDIIRGKNTVDHMKFA